MLHRNTIREERNGEYINVDYIPVPEEFLKSIKENIASNSTYRFLKATISIKPITRIILNSLSILISFYELYSHWASTFANAPLRKGPCNNGNGNDCEYYDLGTDAPAFFTQLMMTEFGGLIDFASMLEGSVALFSSEKIYFTFMRFVLPVLSGQWGSAALRALAHYLPAVDSNVSCMITRSAPTDVISKISFFRAGLDTEAIPALKLPTISIASPTNNLL